MKSPSGCTNCRTDSMSTFRTNVRFQSSMLAVACGTCWLLGTAFLVCWLAGYGFGVWSYQSKAGRAMRWGRWPGAFGVEYVWGDPRADRRHGGWPDFMFGVGWRYMREEVRFPGDPRRQYVNPKRFLIGISAWLPGALFMWLGWKSLRKFLFVRERLIGCCEACGYDLRAHHPGDQCPECGTLIPANPSPPPHTPT
jgi:hypothetical protein